MARTGELKPQNVSTTTVAEFDANGLLIGDRFISQSAAGTPDDLLNRTGVEAILTSSPVETHDLGGNSHNPSLLAALNVRVIDATLDDINDPRTPTAHDLAGSLHNADTLANLNTKISDATLDDSSDPRTPSAHDLAGAEHNADTLANLNTKISDATLIDTGDSRLSDDRDPTQHGLGDGTRHSSSTKAQVNALVSDDTLLGTLDVVNNLTSGGTIVPLSAEQGVVLKALFDGLTSPVLAKAHVAAFDVGSAPGAITVTNTTNVTSATGTSPSTGWTKVAIAFTTPLASADYMVALEVSGSRHAYNQPLILNKTTAGFDIDISENGATAQSCELEFRVLDY